MFLRYLSEYFSFYFKMQKYTFFLNYINYFFSSTSIIV